jgi:hypothetical protein
VSDEKRPLCKICDCYVPLRIVMTDEIEVLLRSNEAKHYMKQIDSAASKLQRFVMQNLKKNEDDG